MWHAPDGPTTFTGPFAVVLAEGIQSMASELERGLDDDDFCEYGHRAFDRLTTEQKIWSLHAVAFGLLDKNTQVDDYLTAYLEATVATIFRCLEEALGVEIDLAHNDPKDDYFFFRRIILAAYEESGGNSPDILEEMDEAPLRVECDEFKEWEWAIESLETKVFWDMDYDITTFDDMPADESATLKRRYGILDDYYTAIPNDPTRTEALKLLEDIQQLCDRVIAGDHKYSEV